MRGSRKNSFSNGSRESQHETSFRIFFSLLPCLLDKKGFISSSSADAHLLTRFSLIHPSQSVWSCARTSWSCPFGLMMVKWKKRKEQSKPRWKLKAHYFIIWSYTRSYALGMLQSIQRKEFVTSAMDFALRKEKRINMRLLYLTEGILVCDRQFLHSSLISFLSTFREINDAFLQKQSSF